MICGHCLERPWRDKPRECSQTCCHEISCGPLRDKSLDKPFAILVLCWHCNGSVVTNKKEWPEARQLAVLKRESPEDYDLQAYLELTNPRAMQRITEDEIDSFIGGLL